MGLSGGAAKGVMAFAAALCILDLRLPHRTVRLGWHRDTPSTAPPALCSAGGMLDFFSLVSPALLLSCLR